MDTVRWGIIGCGDVTEVKSGPALQQASGSSLVAVTRRDVERAQDYARRHRVGTVHATADALIADGDVDVVYVATPPSSHCELALRVAAAGKPCLVEKPMAMTHAECIRMVDGFERAGVPLWVAYYRRALPRFVAARELIVCGRIGRVTSVRVEVTDRLATGEQAANWRFDPASAGGGLFFDLASHAVDLLDFLIAPIRQVTGVALNTGGAYQAEDVTAAVFQIGDDVAGIGLWNFNAAHKRDVLVVTGSEGELEIPIFGDGDLVHTTGTARVAYPFRNPPHVHEPLVQSIVDELRGVGRCASTAASAARASWVLERCVIEYYRLSRDKGEVFLSPFPFPRRRFGHDET